MKDLLETLIAIALLAIFVGGFFGVAVWTFKLIVR